MARTQTPHAFAHHSPTFNTPLPGASLRSRASVQVERSERYQACAYDGGANTWGLVKGVYTLKQGRTRRLLIKLAQGQEQKYPVERCVRVWVTKVEDRNGNVVRRATRSALDGGPIPTIAMFTRAACSTGSPCTRPHRLTTFLHRAARLPSSPSLPSPFSLLSPLPPRLSRVARAGLERGSPALRPLDCVDARRLVGHHRGRVVLGAARPRRADGRGRRTTCAAGDAHCDRAATSRHQSAFTPELPSLLVHRARSRVALVQTLATGRPLTRPSRRLARPHACSPRSRLRLGAGAGCHV